MYSSIAMLRPWMLGLIALYMGIQAASAEFVADGVNLVPLTRDGRSVAIAWAWHGDWISAVRQNPGSTLSQLVILKADGSGETAVCPVGSPLFAEWSWRGDKIAYEFTNAGDRESQGGIFVYDAATGKTSSVSMPYRRGAMDPDDGPAWSPDDGYVAYKVRTGVNETREIWIAEVATGKTSRLLAERGQGKEQRWSPSLPGRIALELEAPGGWDIATVNPDGTDLRMLTNIGVESLGAESPRWSPAGDRVAFRFNKDMTQSERERDRTDLWIARPDGTEARNLTKATSPVTEKQLEIDEPAWSWDGRWIVTTGDRFDVQGNDIPTLYLIDPVSGGYEILLTSQPREEGRIEEFEAVRWSYDSTQLAILSERQVVRNWGPDAEFEKPQKAVGLLDIRTRRRTDLLVLDEQLDRRTILGDWGRDDLEDTSWSPDGRSLLITIAKIISQADEILQPDVFRLDLPAALISPTAGRHDGPPLGRGSGGEAVPSKAVAATTAPLTAQTAPAMPPADQTDGVVTETLQPQHMTVEEAVESLPAKYAQYFTKNASRNLILFKGPPAVLEQLRKDLEKIDTQPPQILVDLLAVELTDEANRSLGLDWTYAKGSGGLFETLGGATKNLTGDDGLGPLATDPGPTQFFYQGLGNLPETFYVRLNALVQDGKGTILANPRTVAMSGKESMIQIRKTLNYFFNEGYDVSGRPIVKKSDISSDTQGRITPTLLADGRIHMTVEIKVGSFTFSSDAGLPEQTNRESTTVVTVQEGQTLVIGGLRQQEMTRSTVKVPVLGDVPVLGALFKRKESKVKNSVLTLFITPHTLREGTPAPQWPEVNAEDPNSISNLEQLSNGKGGSLH